MTPTAILNPTIAAITAESLKYTNAAIVAVRAAEVTHLDGAAKHQVVMDGLLAGSQALEASPNPNVAGIAALVNLIVLIFNACGFFTHKTK